MSRRGGEAAGGQFLLRDHLELTQEDVRCQGSRQELGREDCEKFDVKMKTEFLVNSLFDHNPIWKYIELLLFFSNFAWTFQETGGDMEE